MKKKMNRELIKVLIVGLMSGTSIDGVDAALVRVAAADSAQFELLEFISKPYSGEVRERILSLCDPQTATVDQICQMNFDLGEIFADAVLELLKKAGKSADQIAAIGSHGQTIYHIPGKSTLQIGEPSVIARRTGILTIADFRPADIAAGGEGAPLVPFLDQLLFGSGEINRAVQNIGGIGNVTVVGPAAESLPYLAFDTGPGNMVIDFFAELATQGELSYDRDGLLAAKGTVREEVVCALLTHPYFALEPPKSTGRELFGREYSRSLLQSYQLEPLDWVATATAFAAASVVEQYERFILPHVTLDQIVVAGGGSLNPSLLTEIAERSGLKVLTHEHFGVSSEAKEAVAFALLAHATLNRRPGNVPRATGATSAVILGKTVYP